MVVFELPSVVLASEGLLNSDELLAASLAKIETEYVVEFSSSVTVNEVTVVES